MAELLFLNPNPIQSAPSDGAPCVAFVTLGCKVNQSDTQKAIADFRAAGFRIVSPAAHADVYVVNTCSVTHVADRKSRQWLRRGARANPNALVVATGCYAESGKDTLEEMGEVGLVVGYKDKGNLLTLVLERMRNIAPTPHSALGTQHSVLGTPSWAGGDEADTGLDFKSRTRAMVKIEDGCNDFCTFCIIPFTRGMPRSTPTNKVVEMVNQRLAEGYKEIVLTGVHLGKYGQDHAQRKRARLDPTEAADLPGAVQAVLERTGVPRLRITSVEPTDAIMMLPLLSDSAYTGRLAPHLHLPLQSGCDATLQRMKRDYTTAEYADVVRRCRETVPGISITTDLIVGFPGETEDEWEQTSRFVERMEFAKVHVFPFSRRPGTPAYNMEGQVHPDVRHARTLEMIELSSRSEGAYACAHLGRTLPVLWEHESDGVWSGLTGNYLRVHARTSRDLLNTVTPATLVAYDAQGLWAEPVVPGA
ncbi:MAG TPA: tRNA (N(6)-L-threonylcarbamoyladenosine(37)-C(2))-methylthiotransferase MtaB [Chloroflexia bacterium]|nr:tRNA (N(6)-L-threonylcarbamoyladenosine(37)-C(2))-methylthiotransferase MtaB [Chloroflexia bacterium]